MGKRIKEYIEEMQSFTHSTFFAQINAEARKEAASKLLVQIQFFQHERLVHLIVTCLFAICFVLTVLASVLSGNLFLPILALLFLVLLVPYIHHYYILENGVQKLYGLYDVLLEDKEI